MRRFIASGWYPLLVLIAFAAATAGMVYVIDPATTSDTNQSEIVKYASMGAWAVGPVLALLSLIFIAILNGLRRLFRVRRVGWMHPVVVIVGLLPWLLIGWQLTMNEPRYTPIARAIIDFAGREMFAGSFVAIVFAVLLWALSLLFRSSKKS